MSYIIVFRDSHHNPFILEDSHGFKETFESLEDAKEYAEKMVEDEAPNSFHFFDFKIYEEAIV